MPEEPHVEEAAQAEFGTPDPAMNGPTGARQVVRCPAPTHLHDGDFVALLRQPKGRNTAAKAGSDDDEVEIELVVAGLHMTTGSRPTQPLFSVALELGHR